MYLLLSRIEFYQTYRHINVFRFFLLSTCQVLPWVLQMLAFLSTVKCQSNLPPPFSGVSLCQGRFCNRFHFFLGLCRWIESILVVQMPLLSLTMVRRGHSWSGRKACPMLVRLRPWYNSTRSPSFRNSMPSNAKPFFQTLRHSSDILNSPLSPN